VAPKVLKPGMDFRQVITRFGGGDQGEVSFFLFLLPPGQVFAEYVISQKEHHATNGKQVR
jgi:hypothetical protein